VIDWTNRPGHEAQPDGSVVIHNLLRSTVAAATHELIADGVDWTLSVFVDNAGIIRFDDEHAVCVKVETHNHPSAIEPYGGAATGVGGVIRDIIGTGLGARPIANTDVFCVAFPGRFNTEHTESTEKNEGGVFGRKQSSASAPAPGRDDPVSDSVGSGPSVFDLPAGCLHPRRVLTRVVDGVRDYGNRMGIPTVNGAVYFDDRYVGNPLVFCGSVGVMPAHMTHGDARPGDRIIALGGRTGRDGIHGATFSSAELTHTHAIEEKRVLDAIMRARDYAADDEAGGRRLESGGEGRCLYSAITDCGAGGFSSAVGEMGEKLGAEVHLERAPLKYAGLRYDEIWISESQERMVLAVPPENVEALRRICDEEHVELAEAVKRVLRLPTVGDKSFLVTIGDRTVTGLVSRDPMVGPWQVPVADAAVTLADYDGYAGEAMAMGERPPLALICGPASGRMAVAEALTNLLSAPVAGLDRVRLSANWMAAAGSPGEDAALYETVRAVSDFCVQLGVSIPVGKDSMSMRTAWDDEDGVHEVTAPLSLVVTAFSALEDVRGALTPQLVADRDTVLVLIDLGGGRNRLGGSALAQVYGQLGDEAPDIDDASRLTSLADALAALKWAEWILAYHDRSDGGLLVTLLEMAFAGRVGLDIDVGAAAVLPALFSEEAGVVLQVPRSGLQRVREICAGHGLGGCVHIVAVPRGDQRVRILAGDTVLMERSRAALHRLWSRTSWKMQRLRDRPECADAEHERLLDDDDPGLSATLTFHPDDGWPAAVGETRPRIAVLREQGVNGHVEMAAAFDRAGFEAMDVTMTDLAAGTAALEGFQGLAVCGGFSYGDVLGAGGGWAKSILFDDALRDGFERFFHRPDTFALGVCNGCQMLAHLRELIPGALHWPDFVHNQSEQFEAREVMVEVRDSPSVLLAGMAGSRIPVVVAHGEGRARFSDDAERAALDERGLAALVYIDHRGAATERYPYNPNGSPAGITGATTTDGRVTILMPHPERVWRTVQHSWAPPEWGEHGPWLQLFRNARRWVG